MGVEYRNRGWTLAVASAITLVATALSLGRLWTTNRATWNGNLWAEDGLFPLCIRKSGLMECTFDPFAGYLLLIPRLLAYPTSLLPIEQWALSATLVSAAAWGFVSGLVALHLLRSGISLGLVVLLSILPVIIPLAGLEATTSAASIYMPLLYALSISIILGRWWGRTALWMALAAALVAATNPLTLLLIPVIAFVYLKGRIPRQSAAWVMSGVIAGSVLQLLIVVTASDRRNLAPGGEALGLWLTDLPTAFASLWPGVNFGEATVFGIFTTPVFQQTGLVIALALLIGGLLLCASAHQRVWGAGVLILLGLGFSFVPTVTGYASNRYFVLTVLCVTAAALLLAFPGSSNDRSWVRWSAVVIVLIAWSAAYPASTWRAVPSPVWADEIQRLSGSCASDPMSPAVVTFSPDWPQPGVTQLSPPTTNSAPCSALW